MVVRAVGSGPALGAVQHLMQCSFPGIALQEQHGSTLQYRLPSHACSLAHVFGVLAAHCGRGPIQDYSVSQTTLDQVMAVRGAMGTGSFLLVLPLTPNPCRSLCTLPGSRATGTWGRTWDQGRMQPQGGIRPQCPGGGRCRSWRTTAIRRARSECGRGVSGPPPPAPAPLPAGTQPLNPVCRWPGARLRRSCWAGGPDPPGRSRRGRLARSSRQGCTRCWARGCAARAAVT